VDIPCDERKSRPFWTRYLAELRTNAVLQNDRFRRIALDIMGQPEQPAIPPAVVRIINAVNQGNHQEVIEAVTKTPTLTESLKHEVQVYIDRQKKKNHKGHYDVRAALDLFLEATGDIGFRDVNAQHYRKFMASLDAQEWSDRTKLNRQRMVHTFLKRIEADYNVVYGFIRNPDYKRQTPEGQKVQYTLEEVRTALKNAQGINRLSVLLGLNIGAYWGDITDLKPEHFDGTRINKARAKNKTKAGQVVGSWLLWPETIDALKYGYTKWQLEHSYAEFRKAHDLPEHKAIRKFAAQWIHDNVGEVEARLYRGEGVSGNHGKNYIKAFSPEQTAKLDKALTLFRAAVFGAGEK